ncbi:MAG: hypothetical protein AAFQ94_25135 [Bacteroidota bacterium]
MEKIDNIGNKLIDKILATKNVELLNAIDQIFTSTNAEEEVISLHPAQVKMLEMSEKDIENGNLLSEEELDTMDNEWLN